MKLNVEAAAEDIAGPVEYRLALDSLNAELSASPASRQWWAGSLYWVGPGATVEGLNATLAAMTPHAQALADAFESIDLLVPDFDCADFPGATD